MEKNINFFPMCGMSQDEAGSTASADALKAS